MKKVDVLVPYRLSPRSRVSVVSGWLIGSLWLAAVCLAGCDISPVPVPTTEAEGSGGAGMEDPSKGSELSGMSADSADASVGSLEDIVYESDGVLENDIVVGDGID